MRRPLAILAAIIALAAGPAAAGEPLDLDLGRLGPPSPGVWEAALCGTTCTPAQQADAALMAGDARVRFARLATDLALGLTSTLAQPASTTGHSGFQMGMETGYVSLATRSIGQATASFDEATWHGVRPYWPSRGAAPSALLTPSIHVRKGLPYSVELGGRFTYLAQSTLFAAQLEGKWAFVEGWTYAPDAAVRVAWTRLMGQRDLSLGATELDLIVSKRFGASAVASLTPYLAARYTRVSASTKTLAYGVVTPATPAGTVTAAFPDVGASLYRTTGGVRLTTYAVAMALELTWYGGGTFGKAGAGAGDYPSYYVPASLSGAFGFGFEF